MQEFVNKVWYQGHWLHWFLLPFSWLFGLVSFTRCCLFRLGLKTQTKLPVPVIVVGNITAGGSGKTPMVIYLVELLRAQGFKPGVISRGYGSKVNGVLSVKDNHSANDVGDEPAMIFKRTQVPFVVGSKRVKAAEKLLEDHDVDVIISDDGLQHYALARDIEIVIVDGVRRFGNNKLIPAGPLRETEKRLDSIDFTVVNGGKVKGDELLMELIPDLPVSLVSSLDKLHDKTVAACAGIGNPQRFFDTLTKQGFVLEKQVKFEDHQKYSLSKIASVSDSLPILMTEKDAIKCKEFAQDNWWYLPVDARLSNEFDQQLLIKLKQLDIKL